MVYRPRRLFWATIALAAFVLWLLWPTERINPRSASQLLAGMTLPEVELILGKPLDRSRYLTMISSNITIAPSPMYLSGADQSGATVTQETPTTIPPAPPHLNGDALCHYRLMPTSPWDVALELFGEPLPANWGKGRHMEFWAGSQVVIVGIFREDNTGGVLEHYLVVPVLREGGGPIGWLKHCYQEWCSPGSSTLAAPSLPPVPITPPPVVPPSTVVESNVVKQEQSKVP